MLQTAVHAAPQLLVLIEHTRLDGPLDLLVSRLRPHLVILQQQPESEVGSNSPLSATALGSETRRAYELRALQALGESAPPVRVCVGGADEATLLIRLTYYVITM